MHKKATISSLAVVLAIGCTNAVPTKLNEKVTTTYETKHVSISGLSMLKNEKYGMLVTIKGTSESMGVIDKVGIMDSIDPNTNASQAGCPVNEFAVVINDDLTRSTKIKFANTESRIDPVGLVVNAGDVVKIAAKQVKDGAIQCGYHGEITVTKFDSTTQTELFAHSNRRECFGIRFDFFGEQCAGWWWESVVSITNYSGASVNIVAKNSLFQLFRWQRKTLAVGENFTYNLDTPWAQEWVVLESANIAGSTVDLPDTFRSIIFVTGGSYSWTITPADLTGLTNGAAAVEFFEQVGRVFAMFGL